MKEKTKIETAKEIIGALAATGVSLVVMNVTRSTAPTKGFLKKAFTKIGGLVLMAILSKAAVTFTDETIDELSDAAKNLADRIYDFVGDDEEPEEATT